MPLSEIEAGNLMPIEFDPRGDASIGVRCWQCGYLVRSIAPDRCPCGAVATIRTADGMEIDSTQSPPPEVFRMQSTTLAG